MAQSRSGDGVLGRIAAPFVGVVKRVLAQIGIFSDTQAYKDEIARYENELRDSAGYENAAQPDVEAVTKEAATS